VHVIDLHVPADAARRYSNTHAANTAAAAIEDDDDDDDDVPFMSLAFLHPCKTSPQSNMRKAASQRPHWLQWDASNSPP